MKWLVVAVLWGVAVLNYLDRQVVFSLLPLLEHDLHASPFQLGLISTVFLWTYGLLSPLGPHRRPHLPTRVILASLAIWTLATWLTSHVVSIQGMLWTRALMGASEAFYLPRRWPSSPICTPVSRDRSPPVCTRADSTPDSCWAASGAVDGQRSARWRDFFPSSPGRRRRSLSGSRRPHAAP